MAWDFLQDGPAAVATVALDWLIQSSVLLGLGLLAGRALRRAGAAVQSTAYRTALVAALLCPVASALLASAGLGGLVIRLPGRPASGTAATTTAGDPMPTPAVDLAGVAPGRSVLAPREGPGEDARRREPDPAVARAGHGPAPLAGPMSSSAPSGARSWPRAGSAWMGLGLATWLLGSVVLLARLVRGHRSLARLRSSSVSAGPTALALCRELAARMRLETPEVLLAPFLSSPCLAGLRRPAILLPDDSEAGLRETLVHELAHLARRDLLWNLLRRAATALFWAQPLLWVLSRRVEATAEEVCDDFVVRAGGDRSGYAGLLLDLAERTLPPASAAGVGMFASRSSLGRRVRRILDATRPLSTAAGKRTVAATAAIGLAGTLMAGLVGVGRPAPAAGVASARSRAGDDPAAVEAVSLAGRVVEQETGKAVAGAEIVVTRSPTVAEEGGIPPWAGDSTLRTDADGRFTITFPPEQVAEPRLAVALSRVAHPDFVPLKGYRVPLATLLRGRREGDRPFFEVVTLERGMEYSGRVVTPDGAPAAGVPYWFENWAGGSNRSRHFGNDDQGRTDAEGRFRLRMLRTQSLAIRLTPERHAPYQRFWGTAEVSKNPAVWVPGYLGTLALEPGLVIAGRLLDLRGRPAAGRTLTALGRRNRVARPATTDADGRFAFAPLRPGNYAIYGAGQDMYGGIDVSKPPMPADATVIRPVAVYLEAGVEPGPLELREADTVRVAVRFVDSRGRPFRGVAIKLWGFLAGDKGEADPFDTGLPDFNLASSMNDPEPKATGGRIDWAAQLVSGADGLAAFRVPRGLQHADLSTFPPDETVAFKTRLAAGGPLKYWGGGQLGTLDVDRAGIEVIAYRAATVLATIATEGGEPVPGDASLRVGFNVRGGDYGDSTVKQADGRYRTHGLMPDHEYEFSAWAKGYIPGRVRRLGLPEGGAAELALVLRKKPKPPAVGDPAPPFAVGTPDGQAWGLDNFRGRYLLLHIWSPFNGWDRELPRMDVIHKRFGADRLAMLGLSLANDPEEARKVVEGRKLAWPQAVLRDRGADPIIQDYDGLWPPKSFLIGPDGTILARDLDADKLEELIAKILGEE